MSLWRSAVPYLSVSVQWEISGWTTSHTEGWEPTLSWRVNWWPSSSTSTAKCSSQTIIQLSSVGQIWSSINTPHILRHVPVCHIESQMIDHKLAFSYHQVRPTLTTAACLESGTVRLLWFMRTLRLSRLSWMDRSTRQDVLDFSFVWNASGVSAEMVPVIICATLIQHNVTTTFIIVCCSLCCVYWHFSIGNMNFLSN